MVKPPKTAPVKRRSSLDEPYLPGDPIPAGEAIEMNTDTTWALWKDLHAKENASFADTVPITVPGAGDTQPASSGTLGGIRPASISTEVTLEDALAEARRNNRICPQPDQWSQLYHLLAEKPGGADLAPPLVGQAWDATPALAKRMCFRDHLEWAAVHGCIDEVLVFLKGLPEEKWHHMGR